MRRRWGTIGVGMRRVNYRANSGLSGISEAGSYPSYFDDPQTNAKDLRLDLR